MTRSTFDGDDGRLPVFPLRVFRVEAGVSVYARMLSARYFGCFTHWQRGRSLYCAQEACNPAIHRTERFWKGYAAAEIWDAKQTHWHPVCLELTEHVELDLRDVYRRGQVWELRRDPQTGRRKTPVVAKLLEERDPKTLPAAFDLVPCLRHLYHVEMIDLDAKNPLPPRQMVRPSTDAGPVVAKKELTETPPPSLLNEFRQRIREQSGRRDQSGRETNGMV